MEFEFSKESLPVQIVSLPYLIEALSLDMTYNNKKIILYETYHSPTQNDSEFELFLFNFGKLLKENHLYV